MIGKTVCLFLSCAAMVVSADESAQMPLRRVVLFNSGLGYFEHEKKVDGNDAVELTFDRSDINDLLKSLVVQDMGGGHVPLVSYPSRTPLSEQLRSFPMDLTSHPTLGELLHQLRGEESAGMGGFGGGGMGGGYGSGMGGSAYLGAPVTGADEGYGDFDASEGVVAQATSSDIGEQFQYRIAKPVTLGSGRAALIPIVDQDIEAEKLSIFTAEDDKDHPRLAFRLTNTSDLCLAAGPVTVFDAGAYAGDARIEYLRPDDERLVSYAQDVDLTVTLQHWWFAALRRTLHKPTAPRRIGKRPSIC